MNTFCKQSNVPLNLGLCMSSTCSLLFTTSSGYLHTLQAQISTRNAIVDLQSVYKG